MIKRLQGLVAGILIGGLLTSGVVLAANTTTLYNVIANGIKIFIDGEKLNPKDANGNTVEPIIYNGTTYLPVRAIADAIGKPVYWDGPNYTVYLGSGKPLLQPTVTLEDLDNIGDSNISFAEGDMLVDNYGNNYSFAIYPWTTSTSTYQTLLNMKYSRFKCTIYVPKGSSTDKTQKINIKADGKIIYSSPEITKTSAPIDIDLNVTGCNDFKIEYTVAGGFTGHELAYIGDAGFYQ